MKRYLVLTMLVTLTLHTWAAITFRASAPRQAVEVNEPFRIAYTINTKEAKNFKAPAISGFNLIAGPYTSHMQNVSIMNGKRTEEVTVTYTLTYMATSAGTFTVPPATIEAEGNTVRSNSVQVQVVAASDKPSSNPSSGRSGSNARTSAPSSFSQIGDEDLFITASVSKTKVYEQEAFLLTYKLYSLVDIRGFNNVKLPDFNGFHSQEISLPSSQTLQPENYNGRTYGTVVYRQFVLFPQRSGTLTIPSAQFDASVAQRTNMNDLFDAMLNGTASRRVQKTIRTRELSVEVLPLPADKPEGFAGGVGDLKISSSLKSNTLKTGDALNLTVTVSGTGNLKLITAPEIDFPADFEVYDAKVTEDLKPTPNGMSGKKVFEYLAVPRNAGNYTVPGVTFSFFNPQTQRYQTEKTQSFDLDIAKGKGSSTASVQDFTEQSKVATDIRYLKKENRVSFSPGVNLWGTTGFWLAYLVPFGIFGVLLGIYRKRAIENANVAYAREKKANKAAIRRLKTADKLLHQKKYDAFYDEVIRALWGYVSDKLTIPTSELTKENVAQKLAAKGVSAENTSLFIRTLEDCEFARYAPGDKNEAMDQTYASALRTITEIDNEIKR